MKLEDLRALTQKMTHVSSPDQERKLQEVFRSLGIEPGTLYQELEMSSRFADTHRDISYHNAAVNLHSHTFSEILCCHSNSNVEYLVGAERYRLQKGDIILVPPGVSHRPLLPEQMPEPYVRDVLWISQEFVEMVARFFPDERLNTVTGVRLLRTAGTKWEFLAERFQRGIRETEQKKPGWEMVVLANTMDLFVQLRRAMLDKAAKPLKAEKKELLDQVLEYIEKNYASRLTLAQVASQFYVSESTVSQLFRKKVGVSFYQWVTQRRLIAAKTLIEEGKLLEEVGHLVGFVDYSSFYRAFRQEFGISPRQYRKMQ